MLNYIEFLGIPAGIAIIIAAVFFALQVIGELLTIKGKVVPEFMRMKERHERKKKEKAALSQMTDLLDEFKEMGNTMSDVQRLLKDIDKHYNNDNIGVRNKWMDEVNEHITTSERINAEQDTMIHMLADKLDETFSLTLSMSIENKRNSIIMHKAD